MRLCTDRFPRTSTMCNVPVKKELSERADNSQPAATTATTFLSGVVVLTFSTVLVKLIGLFYKIPMLHYLGSEGMGYFNAAYEWYAMLCVLSTAGLPLAGSMLIAEARTANNDEAVRRIERVMLRAFLVFGTVGSLALFFGAETIARMIGSPDTRYALMAVAPTLFFSCLSGAYRGYFQGCQDMTPTAVSQIIEAMGKLLLGLGFAVFAWRHGMSAPHIAAWAMLGLALGVALSVFYLALHRRRYGKESTATNEPGTAVENPLRRLLGIAVPVTISSSVLSFTRLLDMTMILRRLQAIGYDIASANALYGSYTTMAVPIFNLIPSLITSVALALVPTLTAAIEAGDSATQKSTTRASIRMTALLSLPASLAIAIYSRTILSLLFHGENAAVEVAAPMLSLLSVSIFFSGLITTTNAVLQAYGHPKAPIVSMLVGSAVKLIGAYFLIGTPEIHIYGAPISTFLCDGLIVGINLILISRHTDVVESLGRTLFRPLCVSVIAVGVPGMVYAALMRAGYAEIPLFLAAVPVTLLLFAVLCLRTNLVDEADLAMLPLRHHVRLGWLAKRLRRNEN